MAHIVIKQDGVSMGLVGVDGGAGQFINKSMQYVPTSVTSAYFIVTRSLKVETIIGRVSVVGTDGSAVSAVIRKAPNGTQVASGTVLHSGTFNLKGTLATNQTMTLSTTPSDLILAPGDCVGIHFTGTLTSAVGTFTVGTTPV